MIKILVVEDELPISNLLTMSLSKAGYFCEAVFDGIEAANLIDQEQFDLILLDVMLPGTDGFELMSYIKPMQTPVIFITAKNAVSDRVKGLRMGAEDYIVKPFEIAELMARVEGVLRRNHKLQETIQICGLIINTSSLTVKRGDKEIPLTKKEFDLVLLFAQNPGIALYRDTIYERVWGSDYRGDSRTVDLHVQRMRKKVGWEHCLNTVYKVGYRLNVEE